MEFRTFNFIIGQIDDCNNEGKSIDITCLRFRSKGLGGFLRFVWVFITASTSSGTTSKSETSLLFRNDLFDDDLGGIEYFMSSTINVSADFDSCTVGWDIDLSVCVSNVSLFDESLPKESLFINSLIVYIQKMQ